MKKFGLVFLGLVILLSLCVIFALKLPVFGAHPSSSDKKRFERSEAFNVEKGVFENRRSELFDQMREDSSTLALLREWFRERRDGSPEVLLPEQDPDLKQFMAPGNTVRVIWFGHSTFLLNLAGTVVLVDPVFSAAAAPFSFTAKRFQSPVLKLHELPEIDVVLISHDHYDHLDEKSVRHFVASNTEFVTPLGVGLHLQRWGILPQKITERDWWEAYRVNDVTFTAAPAQHFSGRDGINNNETLWASWAISHKEHNLFYSGDSGYDTHFREIGERLGPFTMTFMENGQYDSGWPAVHMTPEQAVQAHQELRGKVLFPVHWGMFELAFHTWFDPVERISQAADQNGVQLVTPLLGQIISLDASTETQRWWKSLL